MRKDFGPQSWIYPMPVLIIGTYNEDGTPNAMNAAWGGMFDTNMIGICLSSHKTTDNLARTKAFTVSFADVEHIASCDYVGIISGRVHKDKFKKAGFTQTKSSRVNAPIINELPLTLECEMVSFDDCTLVGKIVNVSCDEKYLGEDGKPDLNKLKPVTYDPVHHKYVALGEVVADAYKVGRKFDK